MKQLYSLLFIWLLAGTVARAASPGAAPDTLAGHSRVVRTMSATLCTKITEEDQRNPLRDKTPEESKAIFEQLMFATISAHSDQMLELAKKGRPRDKVSETVGRDVVLQLAKDCPLAQQFIMRMGLASVKNMPATANESEKKMLGTISTDICQRLDKQNAEKPIEQLSPADRKAAVETAMQGGILAHMEELSQVYGMKGMRNKSVMADFGKKIAMQMAEQCPSYLIYLGLDSMNGK